MSIFEIYALTIGGSTISAHDGLQKCSNVELPETQNRAPTNGGNNILRIS